MITLPLWSLICICLPGVALGVVELIGGFYALRDQRQEYRDEIAAEARAEIEEESNLAVCRFQDDFHFLERRFDEDKSKGVRALMFLDENEMDVFAKILIFAKEELMDKMNKDCVEGYLEPAQRHDFLLMIDRCNLFLKRVRHLEEGNNGI